MSASFFVLLEENVYNEDMIRGILFDFDGTITKRYEAVYTMYQSLILHFDSSLKDDPLHQETLIQKCLIWDEGGNRPKKEVFANLQKELPSLTYEEAQAYWYEHFAKYQILNEGVQEVIPLLAQKYELGILSNGEAQSQRKKIAATGLESYFKVVIASGEYGIDKPDSRIYEIAAQKMGLPMEEIAFVGDTFATDLVGAIHVGMQPIWFVSGKEVTTSLSIPMIHNYKEIKDYFWKEEQ